MGRSMVEADIVNASVRRSLITIVIAMSRNFKMSVNCFTFALHDLQF